MINTIVLTVICAVAIGFFLVCLFGFYHAAKERPMNGMFLLLPDQAKQPKIHDHGAPSRAIGLTGKAAFGAVNLIEVWD